MEWDEKFTWTSGKKHEISKKFDIDQECVGLVFLCRSEILRGGCQRTVGPQTRTRTS